MKQLSTAQIQRLAQLANLPLSKQQVSQLTTQITSILEHVNHIQSLDLKGVDQTNQVTQKTNQFRSDDIKPSLTQAEALSQARATHQGYFVVPGVIDYE